MQTLGAQMQTLDAEMQTLVAEMQTFHQPWRPGSLLRPILAISGQASRGPFWPHLAPGRQIAQNETPEAHSGNIWPQAAKMLKMSLLGPIVTTFAETWSLKGK